MPQQFDALSTVEDVLASIELTGRHVLITGASSGLGLETARALVAKGAHVIGTGRSPHLPSEDMAILSRAAEAGGGSFELVPLDLSSLSSVRSCATGLIQRDLRLDAVIANAGVMATPFGLTEDGFETQFGTNYVGHFVLIMHLMPLLSDGSRVITLSSTAHRQANVDLVDPNFVHRSYEANMAYGQSKTAMTLLAVEFDRRFKERGIRAAAVHPGMIYTGLSRHVGREMLEGWIGAVNAGRLAGGLAPFEPKSLGQGAATTVWAAFTAPAGEIGGRYCEDCHVSTIEFSGQDDGVSPGYCAYALDGAAAAALWSATEKWVGEQFPE